jgi:hypothetical protein
MTKTNKNIVENANGNRDLDGSSLRQNNNTKTEL